MGMITTLATSQELQCSCSTPTQPRLPAMQAGGGWEEIPATGTPLSWDRLIPAGLPKGKGRELPLSVLLPHSVLGSPHRGSDLGRGRGGSQLSPEVSILTCAFSFTCSSAWAAASLLLPSPLSRSTHSIPTTPKKLWLQHPHKSLVTENIY